MHERLRLRLVGVEGPQHRRRLCRSRKNHELKPTGIVLPTRNFEVHFATPLFKLPGALSQFVFARKMTIKQVFFVVAFRFHSAFVVRMRITQAIDWSLCHFTPSLSLHSQTCHFGSGRLWPVQFWPSCLASQFWPIHFWPIQFLCCCGCFGVG